jgi:hypothetical protein
MSSGGALVRFPEGTIYETKYSGTADVLYGCLNEDYIGFDLLWKVEIWTNYGWGFWWYGWSTRGQVDWHYCQPYGTEDYDGYSEIRPVKTYDGVPKWVETYYQGIE